MHIVMFYHSLISDWNHGNAHFLRGVVTELQARGHSVAVYEPRDGWSLQNLRQAHGPEAIERFHRRLPTLRSAFYELDSLDLDRALDNADLVLVHEWSPHELVARIGRHRAHRGRYRLLFHDTHHRTVSDPSAMADYPLDAYDGVLAFGEAVRERYQAAGWSRQAWTWHEAADTRIFHPMPQIDTEADLVWIGNWGDNERSEELQEFLLEPVRQLKLSANLHGVRYPESALVALRAAGIGYRDWLPNFEVPHAFARHRFTVHVPRRPYVKTLPGIPTIRVFEALACGIPLVSAPWQDSEGLFRPGRDYLVANNGQSMQKHLRALKHEPALGEELARHGLSTIQQKHTCAHRVDELLAIYRQLDSSELKEQTA
ncbi:glycosyltransferase [Alkalilimnicola ehrlichii]|uniref:Glycosyltransferase n=1 Tax=Alkalilimnicola ehrlichii TaxID=351052 RepID=A0A3E0WK24_9GAMM|nr:glycosyltransferase [Alkalilimnicola ehrlichii]RFA25387.1 glycosyltransferase [Alkalilimnicola ehrlichii]RFA32563.1 glycosyltransferase [Alkalilimnicola ehrlichii]